MVLRSPCKWRLPDRQRQQRRYQSRMLAQQWTIKVLMAEVPRGRQSPENDDVERMEDLGMVVKSINVSLARFGCNPIELAQLEVDEAKVSEVFGRGQFLERAREFGLTPGFALDLGTGWHLNDYSQRVEAARLQERDRPLLLIGSPRCTAWTSLLNFGQARQETVDNLMSEAICHMDMCVRMYNKQLESGMYFLHRSPTHC